MFNPCPFLNLGWIVAKSSLSAAAYTQRTEWQNLCWLFLVVAILSTLLHCIEAIHVLIRDFCAFFAGMFVLFACIFMEYRGLVNHRGVAGCVCLLFGQIVSDQGRGVLGMKNIDLFHYLMAVGFFLLSEGLLFWNIDLFHYLMAVASFCSLRDYFSEILTCFTIWWLLASFCSLRDYFSEHLILSVLGLYRAQKPPPQSAISVLLFHIWQGQK